MGGAGSAPEATICEDDLTDGAIDILTLLVKSGLVTSKSEARRAVEQGGVAVDGKKISDVKTVFTLKDLADKGLLLRRGKKNYRKAVLEKHS